MSNKANCFSCIYWKDEQGRCSLNDNSLIQKECYFKIRHRKKDSKDKIIKNKDQQIAELKVENEQLKKQTTNDELDACVYSLQGLVSNLNQQLKEKDEEIERLTDMKADEMAEIVINNIKEYDRSLKQSQNQKAIDVLEKIKDIVVDKLEVYSYKGESIIGDELISSEELINEIYQLEKELDNEK